MGIFGQEEGSSPEEEFNPKWEKVTWDGWQDVWARPFNESEDSWEISVELPENADPNSVRIGYAGDENRDTSYSNYTVQYKLKDKSVFRFLEIPYKTQEGNTVAEFGVHIGGDFESTFAMDEAKLGSYEPKEL